MMRVTAFLELSKRLNRLITEKCMCRLGGCFAVLGKVKASACAEDDLIKLLQHLA